MSSNPESPLQRLRQIEAAERAARAAQTAGSTRTSIPTTADGKTTPPRRRGILTTISAGLLFLLAKGKVLLGAIKFGSLLQTFSTLGLSAWVYAKFYGPNLAIGLVLLILVHEYGHGIAAKTMGLRVGAPIFIPFFGAMIALKEQPRSTWVEAVVGFGGPFAGMVGGACVLTAGLLVHDEHWAGLLIALAWMTFMINLFNLMPVFGLDGDRITQPFRAWYWLPGCVVIGILAFVSVRTTGRLHPFMLLTLILGIVKGWRMLRAKRLGERGEAQKSLVERVTQREKYVEEAAVQGWQRAASGWAYFGLVVVLSALMFWSQELAAVVSAGR